MGKYSPSGPPFNFLGTLSETQRDALFSWVSNQPSKEESVLWWRVRAQQFRKLGGFLSPAPLWEKRDWQSDSKDFFAPAIKEDSDSSKCVSRIKSAFKENLQSQEELVFQSNHLKTLIEKFEDRSQTLQETDIPSLMDELRSYFESPEYQAILIKDTSDLYQGEPRFRVSPLDPPTPWEKISCGKDSSK